MVLILTNTVVHFCCFFIGTKVKSLVVTNCFNTKSPISAKMGGVSSSFFTFQWIICQFLLTAIKNPFPTSFNMLYLNTIAILFTQFCCKYISSSIIYLFICQPQKSTDVSLVLTRHYLHLSVPQCVTYCPSFMFTQWISMGPSILNLCASCSTNILCYMQMAHYHYTICSNIASCLLRKIFMRQPFKKNWWFIFVRQFYVLRM